MTTQELIAELNRLSLDERLEILEMLSRDIRNTLHTPLLRPSPVEKVRGLLNTDSPLPSQDALNRDYRDYLEAKYS